MVYVILCIVPRIRSLAYETVPGEISAAACTLKGYAMSALCVTFELYV